MNIVNGCNQIILLEFDIHSEYIYILRTICMFQINRYMFAHNLNLRIHMT